MEGTDLAKIVMNPVRIRIAQYLILHEQGTTAQIGEELSDVPKASLYRHMKMLEDAGLIQVVQENKKRGTVEKVFRLNQENPMGGREPGKEEIAQLIHSSLLSIMGEFQRYLKREVGPAEGYGITDIRGFSPVRRRISGVFRETG